jgi:uridine kinase
VPQDLRGRVVVVAGPSGSGKTRLAERLGLPVLRLDDFYRDGDDPALPRLELAGGAPIVDWDDPASWHRDAALAAIEQLCRCGTAEVPVYDIARSRATGTRPVRLGSAPLFLAEGIFAQEVVAGCRDRGLLGHAVCLSQPAPLTFARRLLRDLREHRKPPLVLVRRGLHLLWAQRAVVARARSLGCEVMTPNQAYATVSALRDR